jgi:A/G-specific adenine glycosylase
VKQAESESELLDVVNLRRHAIQKGLLEWAKKNIRQFPWRENRTPYSVLVAEVLLKRTTASAVLRIYKEFMTLYPSIVELAKADRSELEKRLLTIGYHKRRADILIHIAKYLTEEHGDQIPKTREELLEIPHVGHYTANAILSLGYGVPSAMVDSNVDRIIKRLFMEHLRQKAPLRMIQTTADKLAPKDNNQFYNLALLDFGALVCRYGIPKCRICSISKSCDYYSAGKPCS